MSDTLRPIPLYDPRLTPRVRSALDKLSLRDGEFALGQNIRTDTQAVYTRLSDSTLNANPPTGSTGACVGSWSGILNGTAYIVSSWVMTSGSKVATFYQTLSGGAFTEISNAGNVSNASTWGGDANGCTRFSSSAAHVTYAVQATPKRVYEGSVLPPLDVLVVSSGEEYPYIWSPGSGFIAEASYMQHNPITVPTGADQFRVLATWTAFWKCCGSGRTYASSAGPPKVNQTNFAFADSAATYTGSNAVAKLTLGTSVGSGDIATVRFPNSAVSGREIFAGTSLNMIWEVSSADLQFILKDTKIEIGKEDVVYASVSTWNTIYDPTSADITLSQLPLIVAVDAGSTPGRFLISFSLRSIPAYANRTAYHLRFTRTSAVVPSATKTALLLASASTGRGSGFFWGTEWSVTYADKYSYAESAPFVMAQQDTDLLSNFGGPRGPDANQTSALKAPPITSILYDYKLKVKNTDYASGANSNITGGLQGIPSHINIYFRDPASETRALYYASYYLWDPELSSAHFWANANGSDSVITIQSDVMQIPSVTPLGFGYGSFTLIDRFQRDPGVPAPSDFQQSIPRAAVLFSANSRLFAGNNRYDSAYSRGELRFSDAGFFGRFRSVADIDDPQSGSRLMFEGETVQAGVAAAAAAQGFSTIYVLTDQSFNALGASGGASYTGSGFDGTSLARRFRISADGTNSPRSVAEYNGVICWITGNGYVVRFDGGAIHHISDRAVTNSTGRTTDVLDVIADVPASRRSKAVGIWARNRYYLFLTPSAGSSNTRCCVWNEPGQYWESIDSLTSCEIAVRAFDSTVAGSGQRIIVYGTNGSSYAYEEGNGTVSLQIDTRDILVSEALRDATRGLSYVIREIEVACESDSGKSLAVTCYPDWVSGDSGYTFTLNLGAEAGREWLVKFSPTGTVTAGRRAWFRVAGTMTGGKKITGITAYAERVESDGRNRG